MLALHSTVLLWCFDARCLVNDTLFGEVAAKACELSSIIASYCLYMFLVLSLNVGKEIFDSCWCFFLFEQQYSPN